MWLKWIVCAVEQAKRGAFSNAQESWQAVRQKSGFWGQFGGWDDNSSEIAAFLGLWSSQKALEEFMDPDGLHDRICSANKQAATMRSCTTSVFKELFPMSGQFPGIRAASRHGTWLRVASCRVADSGYAEFLEAQREIWLPGMRSADGMLGGSFAGDGADGFLVATLWQSAEHHARYCQEDLPGLRQQVQDMGGFPDHVKGYSVALEPRWNIL